MVPERVPATHVVGRRILSLGGKILLRVPVVRVIYKASRHVLSAFERQDKSAFRSVVPGSIFPLGPERMPEAAPRPARPEGPVRQRLPRAQPSRTKVTFMFTR